MAAKQVRSTGEARRGIQRGVDKLANAMKATRGSKGRNVVLDEKFGAPPVPKGGGTVRKVAPPARRYWPSVNSQRAPSRPRGRQGSPRGR